MSENIDNDDLQMNANKFLLFYLGKELYGVPLLQVTEVVEPQKYKSIPNTVKHFCGVINLRGQIIGVVDLRKKFSIDDLQGENRSAFIVFNSEGGKMAVIADKVLAVAQISEKDIDKNPNVSTEIPLDYLIGVGTYKEDLVNLIDLSKLLGEEEIKSYRSSKLNVN